MTNLHKINLDVPRQRQALALAGVLQALALVHQVATTGQLNESQAGVCWHSLFITTPEDIAEIYGGPDCLENLQLGLKQLQLLLLQDKKSAIPELTRYMIGVIHLQGKLAKNATLLAAIAEQLQHSSHQATLFGLEHANVTASLAEIYTNSLSPLGFRIQVTGNPVYLQQSGNANRVRSLLLAAIRSTILWRQVGGHRWHFLLSKQSLLKGVHTLRDIPSTNNPRT